MTRILRFVVPMLCITAPALASEASDVLHAVAVEAAAPRTLRADMRVERAGVPPFDAVLLEHGRRRYLETRTGIRALLSPGKVVVVRGGQVTRADPGAPLDDAGNVLLEDLAPVGSRTLEVPQVSDAGIAGVVITGAPAPPTAYALLVFTIDPERHVILKTKYYREAINNLVKMSRVDSFTEVAGRTRPTAVTVETLRPRAQTTRLALRWREAPEIAAAVFTPAGLRAPSPIAWP